jgi:predicted aminopeptidase
MSAAQSMPSALRGFALAIACLCASACGTLRYYGHVARGEASLLIKRRSIERVADDAKTDPVLRSRLREAALARRFASDRLGLPRNRSYTTYVDLGRPYVTWNVFATPRWSVDPVTHCFPFAGCVAYLGFFDRARAEREAARLGALGEDTSIEGAAAYSTLGWFADPVLSSMLRWSEDELDGVIFHELAHQLVYAKDDTAFNESFATFVQEEGLREWRNSRGLSVDEDASQRIHDDAFTGLILDLRDRLRAAYAAAHAPEEKQAAKEREFDAFRARYRTLRADWGSDDRYDHWVALPANNARLVPFGLYDRWVPAFAALFATARDEWPAFYEAVRSLARADKQERKQRLDELLENAPPAPTLTR